MEESLTDDPPRCSACQNLYNEATGHRHSDRTVLCGSCARDWLAWRKRHEQGRWGGLRFYDLTETSRNKPAEEDMS